MKYILSPLPTKCFVTTKGRKSLVFLSKCHPVATSLAFSRKVIPRKPYFQTSGKYWLYDLKGMKSVCTNFGHRLPWNCTCWSFTDLWIDLKVEDSNSKPPKIRPSLFWFSGQYLSQHTTTVIKNSVKHGLLLILFFIRTIFTHSSVYGNCKKKFLNLISHSFPFRFCLFLFSIFIKFT